MIKTQIGRLANFALALMLGVAFGNLSAPLMAQKQASSDKPWRELVSSEGHFRVLLPDTPNEMFVPINGQFIQVEARVFAVKSPEAFYAVMFGDFGNETPDAETIRAAFDNGRDKAISEGKFILMSEKDIGTAKTPAREYVMNDGAFVFRTRVYFVKGRIYQTMFGGPGLNGMSAAMAKYYDGLAAKFLNSFKIGA
jgi:hypothetical protein